MGTSSSSSGPTDTSPLLPPWADPLPAMDNNLPADWSLPGGPVPQDSEANHLPTPSVSVPSSVPATWTSAKGALSRLARGRSSSGSFAPSFRRYVGAHGGGRNAAHTASSGRAVTGALGGFLSDVIRDGVVGA